MPVDGSSTALSMQPARFDPLDLEAIVASAEPALQALRGARLFLTGGTGFFGTWLIESLVYAEQRLALQLKVTVLARQPERFLAGHRHLIDCPALGWHVGDVRDFEFPQGTYSHVIHAATPSTAHNHPQDLFDTIVLGTRRVLQFAQHTGVEDLLFTSSGAVYGEQPRTVSHLAETALGAPDVLARGASYGEAKRAAEHLCVLAAADSRLRPKIARCFAFMGPGLPLDAHFAVGNFMRDALAKQPVKVQSDGRALRSYLYPTDLIDWLLHILVRAQPLRAYNVGSDRAVSIAELAEQIARRSAVAVHVRDAPQSGLAARYVPDVGRARHELGLDVVVDLEAAIERTMRWHEAGRPQG